MAQSKSIPLSVPVFYGKEAQYVQECIASGWVSTAGPWVSRFEKEFSAYVGTPGAVSVSSGTAALHLALIVAGVGPEDEVLVPTLTFIATMNSVRYVGATPVFFDCDDQLNLCVSGVAKFLREECRRDGKKTINKRSGRPVKAILPVHVFGFPADVAGLQKLAEEFGLIVIEDATESLGSRLLPSRRMAGTSGLLGCYSFNGNKIITSGGGGMIVSHDEKLLNRARYLSTQAKDDEIFYEHGDVGYNYRLTSLQAALGIAQLEEIEKIVETKRRNFGIYKELLADCGFARFLEEAPGTRANYWLYALKFEKDLPLRNFIAELDRKKIQVRPIWMLNHLQKPYRSFQTYEITHAPRVYPRVLNVPSSSNLTPEDIRDVAGALREAWAGLKE